MHTSRPQVARLLDPRNDKGSSTPFNALRAIGRKLKVQLVAARTTGGIDIFYTLLRDSGRERLGGSSALTREWSSSAMASAWRRASVAVRAAPSATSRPACLTSHCHSPSTCKTEGSHEPRAARSTGRPP
jgi:hypothetical protein